MRNLSMVGKGMVVINIGLIVTAIILCFLTQNALYLLLIAPGIFGIALGRDEKKSG